MYDSYYTPWDVIKRFLAGWILGFILLFLVSCGAHWDFITATLAGNLWSLFNAVMPLAIMVFMLYHLLGSLFR